MRAGQLPIGQQLAHLRAALRRNRTLTEVLARAASIDLPGWYLVAGCLYQTVWNVVTGQPRSPRASASARLFARFSSAVPQVITVGTGGASGRRPYIRPTKRVIRAKRGKPASCASKRPA